MLLCIWGNSCCFLNQNLTFGMLEIEKTYCSSNSIAQIIFVILCSPKKIPGPLKRGGASTCARCGSGWFSKYIQLIILFWIQGLLSTTVYVSTLLVNVSPCVEKLGVFELSVYIVQKFYMFLAAVLSAKTESKCVMKIWEVITKVMLTAQSANCWLSSCLTLKYTEVWCFSCLIKNILPFFVLIFKKIYLNKMLIGKKMV